MGKQLLRKPLAVGLALAMTVGLCACGGKTDGDSGNRGSSGGRGSSSANAQLAKEYVYKLEEFDFPQFVPEGNGYVNVYSTAHRDGKVYLVLGAYDWTKEKEEGGVEEEMSLVVMNEDGSGLQVTPIDTSAGEGDGAPSPTSGAARTLNTVALNSARVSPAMEMEIAAGAVISVDDPVEDDNIWEYTNYGNFTISSGGRIFGTKRYSYENYNDPEQVIREEHTYVCCWEMDGSRLWETEVEGLRSDEEGAEWIYISGLIPGKDGGATLMLNGDNMYRMGVSSDGALSEREQLSEETGDVLNYRQLMVEREDGTMLLTYSDENDWTKTYLVDYDPATDTLGEASELPASFGWNGYGSLSAGLKSDLIFSRNDGIYIYNKGDGDATKKMDFVNSDVNISNFLSLVELDGDSFVGIYNENYQDEIKAAVFTYRDPKDIPDKSVIVLAGNWLGSDMRQRVVEYNRGSDVYRIVLREYDSYNSYEDYNAGLTRLNNDIITGGMPDILITDGLPVENYISKGLLADIGALIEQDPELSKVEFLQNVFDAYSVDGTLYYVIPNFNVSTMIAKTAWVGDRTSWSLEEMRQVLDTMGENAQAIGELSRDGFMSTAMSYCGNDFIDVKTGKCNFNSENFISMMEYAKTLPEEIDWDELYGKGDYWETYESQYRDDRTLLMRLYIGNLQSLNYSLNGNFGEPVTYIGFPTESGKGSYITANQSYVLSAKSANLDGAWDFIRYYLTDEYQEETTWGLSVNKKLFMERAQEALKKPTYTDENGEEVEYEETFWMNGEQIPLLPLNQEQVDQVVDFILSVDRAYYYNEDVLNIINEEMDAFYTGQKSAQDVANIIQSRAQIYVDENR